MARNRSTGRPRGRPALPPGEAMPQIGLRIREADLEAIEEAARLIQEERCEFIRVAALKRAERVRRAAER